VPVAELGGHVRAPEQAAEATLGLLVVGGQQGEDVVAAVAAQGLEEVPDPAGRTT
jgi:hypothetical protein